MNPIPHSTFRRSGRALLVSALALALAACASSRGLNPQGHVLDVDSLHSERTMSGSPPASVRRAPSVPAVVMTVWSNNWVVAQHRL